MNVQTHVSKETIAHIAQSVLKTQELPDFNAPLAEVGLDSMRLVDLFLVIEEELHVSFRDEDLQLRNFRTVTTIYETLVSSNVSV